MLVQWFALGAIFIALVDIIILDFAVLLLVAGAFEVERRAGYFLLPYIVWLLFQTYLNVQFWFLN